MTTVSNMNWLGLVRQRLGVRQSSLARRSFPTKAAAALNNKYWALNVEYSHLRVSVLDCGGKRSATPLSDTLSSHRVFIGTCFFSGSWMLDTWHFIFEL